MTHMTKQNPDQVPMLAMPTGEIDPYGWIERSVWTSRMVECLRHGGPEGGKWYSLHDKVFATKTLEAAFAQVYANRGAPGVDGVTVERFKDRLEKRAPASANRMAGGHVPSGCGEAGMDR